jgi:hypothetical protein
LRSASSTLTSNSAALTAAVATSPRIDEPPGFGLGAITTQTWEEPPDSVWAGSTLNLSLRVI